MTTTSASFMAIDKLPDGRILHLRAIDPLDRGPLRDELFLKLGRESLRNRFFCMKLDLSPSELTYFTRVDFLRHVALVAELDCGSNRRLVGVARFVRESRSSEQAEVAITVADEFQGKGIGSHLLSHIIDCARDLGITHFEGTMLAQNNRMQKILRKTRLSCVSRLEGGIVSMSLAL